jgi:hypothetical protein
MDFLSRFGFCHLNEGKKMEMEETEESDRINILLTNKFICFIIYYFKEERGGDKKKEGKLFYTIFGSKRLTF